MSATGHAVSGAREQILDALRHGERFVLLTHEHPDGDALGSLSGMHGLLSALGKDSVMFVCADGPPRSRPMSTSARSSSSTAATSIATRSRRSAARTP